jgi:hypothetical protein
MSGWVGEIEKEKSPAISGRADIDNGQGNRATSVPLFTRRAGDYRAGDCVAISGLPPCGAVTNAGWV